MPYQPAVTPNAAPIGQGLANAGKAIGEGLDTLRKERELNDAADTALEHLHATAPQLLEPFLRKSADTQTPSAELLGQFLGKNSRTKKEALLGAAAAEMMRQNTGAQQAFEATRIGLEGQRVNLQQQQMAQQGQQFTAEQQRMKTATAMQFAEKQRDRKQQSQVNIVRMPDGSTMVTNGSGNFSVQRPAQAGLSPEPEEARQIRQAAKAQGANLFWNGKELVQKSQAQQQWTMDAKGNVVPVIAQDEPAQANALPPLPDPIIKRDSKTGFLYRYRGGDKMNPQSWQRIQ